MSPQSRFICRCTANACSSHPQGFRNLSRSKMEQHRNIEAQYISSNLSLRHTVQQFLASAEAERTENISHLPPPGDIVFISNLGPAVDLDPPSLRALLDPGATTNQMYLSLDDWHFRILETLPIVPDSERDLKKDVLSFEEKVRGDLCRIKALVLAQLEEVQTKSSKEEVTTPPGLVLVSIESEIGFGIRRYHFPDNLVFTSDEGSHICAEVLNKAHPNNRTTIEHLRWLEIVSGELHTGTYTELSPSRIDDLIHGLDEHKANIMTHIACMKASQRDYKGSQIIPILRNSYKPLLLFTPMVVLTAMLLLSLKVIYRLPTHSIRAIFAAFTHNMPSYGVPQPVIDNMAQHPHTYNKVIGMEMKEERFAVCPICCTTYPLDQTGLPSISKCTSRANKDSAPCGTLLCKTRRGKRVPITVLRRKRLDDWLQQLLARPGLLEKIDAAWDATRKPPKNPSSDFWDGSFVREFKGPDGAPISSYAQDESRLLFSLSVDWFNPYYNKIAGKKASTGVVVMTCLNLPPQERFLDENVYVVALLPGRHQQADINPSLEPLINDLLLYWEKGVGFIGIPNIEGVRLIRCALVQLVCDLPAARKVAGFMSHSATFMCSVCLASSRSIEDLTAFRDPQMQRDLHSHMEHAHQYLEHLQDGGIEVAENGLNKTTNPQHVRWSILNKLPYWNPIKCTVLDVMHMILLGLCRFHWQDFWHGYVPAQKGTEKDHGKEKAEQIPENHDQFLNRMTLVDSEPDENEEEDPPRMNTGLLDDKDEDIIGTFQRKKPLLHHIMKKARNTWVHGNDKAIRTLNISQLLCLLHENGGVVPSIYNCKGDLAEIVLRLRKETYNLPRSKRPLYNANHMVENTSVNAISASENLMNDTRAVPVPTIFRQKASHKPAKSYISAEELKEIQSDIRSIITPSWFTRIQPTFGEVCNGKLKADEWRSLFSVYLPLTFLRLWGGSNDHRLQLKSLLLLSIIVNITCSTTVSDDTIEFLGVIIAQYLHFLSVLGRESSHLVPNHHLSLHLPHFMRLHGPSHSHWAFPIERLIGKLQRSLHNPQIDDIAGTIFKSFNLRVWLKMLSQQGMQTASLPRWTDFGRTRERKEQAAPIPQQILASMKAKYGLTAEWGVSLPELTIGEVSYRCGINELHSDSNIGYFTNDIHPRYEVGRIKEILRVRTAGGTHSEVILLVNRYKSASTSHFASVCENFTHEALRLHVASTHTEDALEAVSMEHLVGHIAISKLTIETGEIMLTIQLSKDIERRRVVSNGQMVHTMT